MIAIYLLCALLHAQRKCMHLHLSLAMTIHQWRSVVDDYDDGIINLDILCEHILRGHCNRSGFGTAAISDNFKCIARGSTQFPFFAVADFACGENAIVQIISLVVRFRFAGIKSRSPQDLWGGAIRSINHVIDCR